MSFPPPHIHPPSTTHTHTAILLHGRGSNGPEFAEELFSSSTSSGKNLPESLPHFRWVFPTSRDRWSELFQEELCAWFDAYSISDITERQEGQLDGLRESVSYVLGLIEREIEAVGGDSRKVYLGGISQGMATALWALFCARGRVKGRLGGVFGFCGWLPFTHEMERAVRELDDRSERVGREDVLRAIADYCAGRIGVGEQQHGAFSSGEELEVLMTPVLLGHGTDDEWVSVALGRQAFGVFKSVLTDVEWKEYVGAERDGHWIKEPEGIDYIVDFLQGPVKG
ncbi:alpha/beta-hydrolase [Aspergillus karnatakaensis]|uniref:alpha/beta hydrolase n=1 Tax=Aspergillus karnatakaensis TaxID=1810916 RepID=UPI003CCCD7B8